MKKYYSILMAAVLVGLAACAKQEAKFDTPADTPEIVAEDLVVFTATDGEAKTKSEIDGSTGKFTWNTTDRIAVHTTAGYKLSATAVVDGEDAGLATFTVDKGGAAINGFALSPYTLVYDDTETVNSGSAASWGKDNGALVVNLPGTYTLADITGDKSPIPAIAENEDGDLHFKQLGALLRVTLNNLPPSTQSVTIDFNDKKVWGAFTISSPEAGTSYIETASATGADAAKDVITINIGGGKHGWLDGQVVNIPIPIGEYTTITVTSWDAADGADGDGNATLTMTRYIKVVNGVASNWTPSRRGARKVTASLPAFSISEDRNTRVEIAASNVYKDGEGWHFFTNPYDCIVGYATAHVDGSRVPHDTSNEEIIAGLHTMLKALSPRDIFQWAEITDGTEGKTTDMGAITTAGWKLCSDFSELTSDTRGTTRFARVILTSENEYPTINLVLRKLNKAGTSYLVNRFRESDEDPVKNIGGTSGAFFFPDNWPEDLNTATISYTKNEAKKSSRSFTILNDEDYSTTIREEVIATEITKEVFGQLLSAGAVFLPACGYGGPSTWYTNVGRSFSSWCSCKTEGNPLVLTSSDADVKAVGCIPVSEAQYRPARLVRDIN